MAEGFVDTHRVSVLAAREKEAVEVVALASLGNGGDGFQADFFVGFAFRGLQERSVATKQHTFEGGTTYLYRQHCQYAFVARVLVDTISEPPQSIVIRVH